MTRWNDYKIVENDKSTTTVGGNESLKHIYFSRQVRAAGWVFQKDDKVYLLIVEGFEKTITQFTHLCRKLRSLDGTGAVTD